MLLIHKNEYFKFCVIDTEIALRTLILSVLYTSIGFT